MENPEFNLSVNLKKADIYVGEDHVNKGRSVVEKEILERFIKKLKGRTFFASTNNHKPSNPDVKQGGGEVVWLDDILELAGDAFQESHE